MQARQGDVFIERISELPGGLVPVARERGRVVLAHGEVTGHAHAIANRDARLLARPGETLGEAVERWLHIGDDGATLTHEEHATITLAPGVYRVVHQREWTDDMEPILVAD